MENILDLDPAKVCGSFGSRSATLMQARAGKIYFKFEFNQALPNHLSFREAGARNGSELGSCINTQIRLLFVLLLLLF